MGTMRLSINMYLRWWHCGAARYDVLEMNTGKGNCLSLDNDNT